MRDTRPDPARLRAFWFLGVFPAALAVTTGVLASQEAGDAGGAAGLTAAACFASGAALALVLRAVRALWRPSIRRFPRVAIVAAIVAFAIAPFWAAFGPHAHAAVLALGCGFLAATAALAFVALARSSRGP